MSIRKELNIRGGVPMLDRLNKKVSIQESWFLFMSLLARRMQRSRYISLALHGKESVIVLFKNDFTRKVDVLNWLVL
jgi:hypothetical protein